MVLTWCVVSRCVVVVGRCIVGASFAPIEVDKEEEAHVGGKEVDSSEPSTDESEDDVDLLSRANGSSRRARQQRVIIDDDDN